MRKSFLGGLFRKALDFYPISNGHLVFYGSVRMLLVRDVVLPIFFPLC